MYFNVFIYAFGSSIWGFKKLTRYSPSTGPITKFSAPVVQGGSSQLFLHSLHCHPLSSPASCPLPARTAAFITCLDGPSSTPFPLFLHSLPLTKSHQGSTELSLMTCWETNLGSVPCLTPVVATPHPSEMLHFWNDDFDWHHPAVFFSWVFPGLDLYLQVLLQSVHVARWISEGNTSHYTRIIFTWESLKRAFSWPILHSQQTAVDPNKPFQPST